MAFKRVIAGVTTGLAATALLAAPVAAQVDDQELPLQVSPTSGPVGTVIDVSGGHCTFSDADPDDIVYVNFRFYGATDDDYIEISEHAAPHGKFPPPDEAGNWAGQLTVPDHATPGTYTISAICALDQPLAALADEPEPATLSETTEENGDEGYDEWIKYYEPVDFEVTGPAEPPASTTTTTIETTTTTVAPAKPGVAVPATPITAVPTYTG